jgi:hypothetical protein
MTKINSYFKALLVCGLAFALLSPSAYADAMKQSKAIARNVKGDVKYKVGDGQWVVLKNGTELESGATVKTTGPESAVNLFIAQNRSSVRVLANTLIKIENLQYVGGADGDSDTMLNLQSGTIVGSVDKLSRASHYEIRTPNGVAGIRGTDFAIMVQPIGDGTYKVTFTSITGEVIAAALVNGDANPITTVLNTGESWTPGSNAAPTAPELLTTYQNEIRALINQGGGVIDVTPSVTPPLKESPISPVVPGAQ